MQNHAQTVFYLMRHGETDWNVKGLLQGQTDIELNDVGRAQAVDAALHLKNLSFTSCYSSDLKRAFETAQIILNQHNSNLNVQSDERLRERQFGSWEGKTWNEYNCALPEEKAVAESDQGLIERFLTCLHETAVKEKGGHHLVLTHGGVMCTLLSHLLKLDGNVKIFTKNAGYIKLVYSNNHWVIDETHNVEIVHPAK